MTSLDVTVISIFDYTDIGKVVLWPNYHDNSTVNPVPGAPAMGDTKIMTEEGITTGLFYTERELVVWTIAIYNNQESEDLVSFGVIDVPMETGAIGRFQVQIDLEQTVSIVLLDIDIEEDYTAHNPNFENVHTETLSEANLTKEEFEAKITEYQAQRNIFSINKRNGTEPSDIVHDDGTELYYVSDEVDKNLMMHRKHQRMNANPHFQFPSSSLLSQISVQNGSGIDFDLAVKNNTTIGYGPTFGRFLLTSIEDNFLILYGSHSRITYVFGISSSLTVFPNSQAFFIDNTLIIDSKVISVDAIMNSGDWNNSFVTTEGRRISEKAWWGLTLHTSLYEDLGMSIVPTPFFDLTGVVYDENTGYFNSSSGSREQEESTMLDLLKSEIKIFSPEDDDRIAEHLIVNLNLWRKYKNEMEARHPTALEVIPADSLCLVRYPTHLLIYPYTLSNKRTPCVTNKAVTIASDTKIQISNTVILWKSGADYHYFSVEDLDVKIHTPSNGRSVLISRGAFFELDENGVEAI